MLPLTILSGAFVRTSTVPAWLRPISEGNPVTLATDVVRDLVAGTSVTDPLLRLLPVCGGLLPVFLPLATRALARER